MPPCHRSTFTSFDFNSRASSISRCEAAVFERSLNAGSSNLALPVVVPIVVGIILIMAVLLMPKNFFSNLLSNTGTQSSQNAENSILWFGRRPSRGESLAPVKSQLTFVERHLETLRAWQKPSKQAQPPLPLYLAKSVAAQQPRRPSSMTFKEWQERQRQTTLRLNPMHEFKLSGVGVHSPAYWKKVVEEMEARKSWWEKVKDRLQIW